MNTLQKAQFVDSQLGIVKNKMNLPSNASLDDIVDNAGVADIEAEAIADRIINGEPPQNNGGVE